MNSDPPKLDYATPNARPARIPPAAGLGMIASLILTFCMIMIGAGHGVIPMGLLLILGWWSLPALIAWLGIGMQVFALFSHQSLVARTADLLGTIGIGISWLSVAFHVEAMKFYIATSLPFFLVFGVKMFQSIRSIARSRSDINQA